MRKKKAGFTLGEVLVSIMIIGIIMAISMETIKIVKSSYTSLAYYEFKNIQQIAAEMIAGIMPYTEEDSAGPRTITHRQSNGVNVQVITHDDEVFCNTLVQMSNTAGATNCDSLLTASFDTEPYVDIDGNTAPTFLSTSGKKYYLTSRTSNSNISSEYGYRLLAVDLNGSQKPNTTRRLTREIPDIVTFMIMDTGEIFPLGVAADNIVLPNGQSVLYLNSKLKGYYYSDITREDDESGNKKGVPSDCFMNTKDGTSQICNYAVVYIPNHTRNANNNQAFYTYREAYCGSLGSKQSHNGIYCDGLTPEPNCPPSESNTQFDVCRVENVKPVFRYNF